MENRNWLSDFMYRNGAAVGTYLLVAVFIWVFILILIPQITMLDRSMRLNLSPSEIGGPKDVYTLFNYKFFLFGGESNPEYWNTLDIKVLYRTLIAAFFVTVFDLILCYPIAYVLATSAHGAGMRLLILSLIVPFWVNEILRAFAFRILFGATGIINTFGISMGLWEIPFDFIRADVALYAGLGYAYILLMIFPLFNAMEALDKNQIEAAQDMGAKWWQVHKRVVIPFAKPGIASGCTMVFMLTCGALAAPQILGGPRSLWFTQRVYQWFTTGNNWNAGSAYAIVLLVTCVIIVLILMKIFKVGMGAIGK